MAEETADQIRARKLAYAGSPLDAVELYARWWELETWLRDLLYIELRTRYGPTWTDEVGGSARVRQGREMPFDYMISSDLPQLLAFADFSVILDLIERHWGILGPHLLGELERWRGRMGELQQIRNRIAHCRWPHQYDLARVRQMLIDLEPGARRVVRSYTRGMPFPAGSGDAVVDAWTRNKRQLRRLAGGGRLDLNFSVRPWAVMPTSTPLSGSPGIYWLLTAHTLPNRLFAWSAREQWQPGALPSAIAHVVAPTPEHVAFTIPATEAPDEVIAALGWAARSIGSALSSAAASQVVTGEEVAFWKRTVAGVDARVLVEGPVAFHWEFIGKSNRRNASSPCGWMTKSRGTRRRKRLSPSRSI